MQVLYQGVALGRGEGGALSGVVPFDGKTLAETITRRLNETAPALSSFAQHVTPELESFVHRLIQCERDERFGSAGEAAEQLGRLITNPVSSPAITVSVTVSVTEPRVATPRLAGRQLALQTARAALSDAADGVPRVLLIEGEAGVGKSRFLEELRRQARVQSCLILRRISLSASRARTHGLPGCRSVAMCSANVLML